MTNFIALFTNHQHTEGLKVVIFSHYSLNSSNLFTLHCPPPCLVINFVLCFLFPCL